MNYLLEKGYLMEKDCGQNFAYVLCDNSMFLPTEFKVLQSQVDSCFVKCMKMQYNGDILLYYLTKDFKPLESMIPNLNPEGFMTIITNLLADVIDVKHNGFLSCQNVDISFDKIFVEPSTYKVQLVYIPINKKNFSEYPIFENELRSAIVKLIAEKTVLHSPKVMQLSASLSNGMLSLENLVSQLKLGKIESGTHGSGHEGGHSGHGTGNKPAAMKLIALNAPEHFELVINRPEYIIGKKKELVDGYIHFNKNISRVHCKIEMSGSGFTITDMKSANGTYVNKVRLVPEKPCAIKHGDTIRMANVDFRVSIK